MFSRRVYSGIVNNTHRVVLKRTTRKNNRIKQMKITPVGSSEDLSEHIDPETKVFLCNNLTSEAIYKNIDADFYNIKNERLLWLDIQNSIEPILLKLFQSNHEFPVPKFLGSCGNIIMKEYKGNMLKNYISHNWMERAFLSVQLLKMAEIFTFGHDLYMFYFMDWSGYNIAVNESGIVSLIDLDYVVINEKKYIDDQILDDVHTSFVFNAVMMATAPDDICKHPISDHNYYAICRYILLHSEEMGKGLLEDIPDTKEHTIIRGLLEECAEPIDYPERISAGRNLTKVLDDLLIDFKWMS